MAYGESGTCCSDLDKDKVALRTAVITQVANVERLLLFGP